MDIYIVIWFMTRNYPVRGKSYQDWGIKLPSYERRFRSSATFISTSTISVNNLISIINKWASRDGDLMERADAREQVTTVMMSGRS